MRSFHGARNLVLLDPRVDAWYWGLADRREFVDLVRRLDGPSAARVGGSISDPRDVVELSEGARSG